jgi:hypothetical protein
MLFKRADFAEKKKILPKIKPSLGWFFIKIILNYVLKTENT